MAGASRTGVQAATGAADSSNPSPTVDVEVSSGAVEVKGSSVAVEVEASREEMGLSLTSDVGGLGGRMSVDISWLSSATKSFIRR